MSVTIKEIARSLGLAPSSVSRALSGSSEVSESTRQRVLEVARELNYSPNLMAQSLVGSAQNLIGCLILEFANPFFVPMIRAIEDLAEQRDHIIFLSESRRQLGVEKRVIERFRRIQVAGIIVMPVLGNLSHLRMLEDEGTPIVVVGRDVPGLSFVNVNNKKSGYLVGQYLLRQGHRRIGFIYSSELQNMPERSRLAGLHKALDEAGVELKHLYTVSNNRLEGGEQAGEQWLSQSSRPTAVFGANDLLAMGFIHRISKAGVSVPDEVAVVGHDDIPFANLFSVPLTTIALPKREIGRVAMQILLDCLDKDAGSRTPQQVVLEPELIVRRSCGG
ncbi:MAG TPA: LacI family transcriptional regulator [Chloroflexi bacterium]|nr:MAG: hypothetical protein B6243_07495 [Anaerolineaceae bacterium 4572_5.2]HEY83611.1 LacI family transcriptional regulator [Chloroflexota bacterium]